LLVVSCSLLVEEQITFHQPLATFSWPLFFCSTSLKEGGISSPSDPFQRAAGTL